MAGGRGDRTQTRPILMVNRKMVDFRDIYERVSIVSRTGAAICTVAVVARCNGR
jgi:hypothetical protein